MDIKKTLTKTAKKKPDPDKLRFGKYFTDHMFIMDYKKGEWKDPRIVPYAPLEMDPASLVLHYGQEMFEGLKTYKDADGGVNLFRPDMNAKRTNKTNDRICIPPIDEGDYVKAIKELVDIDKDWIPEKEGTSLYIRPFIIATSICLGVKPSDEYKFIIILSPVGPYYSGGLEPTKIFVEDKYIRASRGGTGEAKIGANYVMGMKSQIKAEKIGYSQVLWLDGAEQKYVEEIGTSNAFFVIDDEVVTPPLMGTILPGITRDSVITILKDWGIKVREERLEIAEVFELHKKGHLKEVFATGTAAVISPVGRLKWKDQEIEINSGQIGKLSQRLYDEITGIQTGKILDRFNWIEKV